MAKVAQSYEMVRNFNNFKAFVMFAVKKLEVLLILVENAYVSAEYAYVSAENFLLTMLMLVRKIFLTPPTPPPPRRKCRSYCCSKLDLAQILG